MARAPFWMRLDRSSYFHWLFKKLELFLEWRHSLRVHCYNMKVCVSDYLVPENTSTALCFFLLPTGLICIEVRVHPLIWGHFSPSNINNSVSPAFRIYKATYKKNNWSYFEFFSQSTHLLAGPVCNKKPLLYSFAAHFVFNRLRVRTDSLFQYGNLELWKEESKTLKDKPLFQYLLNERSRDNVRTLNF